MSDLDYSLRDVERRPVLWTILLTSELKQRGGLGVFFNSLNLCLFSESGNRRSRDVLLCPDDLPHVLKDVMIQFEKLDKIVDAVLENTTRAMPVAQAQEYRMATDTYGGKLLEGSKPCRLQLVQGWQVLNCGRFCGVWRCRICCVDRIVHNCRSSHRNNNGHRGHNGVIVLVVFTYTSNKKKNIKYLFILNLF